MTREEAVVLAGEVLQKYGASTDKPSVHLANALLTLDARCKAMERVVAAAFCLRHNGGHESTWCLASTPCGNCAACLFHAALDALDTTEPKP